MFLFVIGNDLAVCNISLNSKIKVSLSKSQLHPNTFRMFSFSLLPSSLSVCDALSITLRKSELLVAHFRKLKFAAAKHVFEISKNRELRQNCSSSHQHKGLALIFQCKM